MRIGSLCRFALVAGLVVAVAGAARAETPRQIQALIASGQAQTALADLQPVLQAHPDSAMAWYLSAEAQDAAGNAPAARDALAKAEQFAPGLPFAAPAAVAALRAHLRPAAGFHFSPVMIIGVLVLLFLAFRMFGRRRFSPGYGGNMPMRAGPDGYGPVGPGYGGGMGGGGFGSTLMSGLAAGAGFAVGERVIDAVADDFGGNRGVAPGQGFDQSAPPDRDDGLLGSPDWGNDGSQDSGGDSGNSW
jgi:hypothetical protein